MIIRNTLKAAALASVCLVPLAAAAQDDTGLGFAMPETAPNTQALTNISNQPAEVYDNEVTVGVRGQSSQSAVFGRYNGQYNDGATGTIDLMMHSQRDWRSADTFYLDLDAKNLDFGGGSDYNVAPNAEASMKFGNQGTWGMSVDYWGNTFIQSNQFHTIFGNGGALLPGVPGNTGVDTNHLGTSTLSPFTAVNAPYAQTQVVGVERERGTVDGSYRLNDWLFGLTFTHEHKDGSVESSWTVGGGANDAMAFALPVDYDTDRVDLSAAYNTPKWQTTLKYTFSNFTNNNLYMAFAPVETFSLKAGTDTETFAGGAYALPPSNMAHTFTAQTGYDINDVTRLNSTLQYGLQLQNADLPPADVPGEYTQAYVGGVAGAKTLFNLTSFPGNPSSLNASVSTLFGNLALTTRPFDKADLRASYTIDGRMSSTGAQQIIGVPDGTSTKDRWAVQPSWIKQTGSIDVGYRVLPSTKVGVGYSYSEDDRTEAITATTTDNKVTANVHTTFTPGLTGSAQYTYLDRSASAPNFYVWANYISAGSDCGGANKGAVTCQEIPFYEAAQTSHTVQGRLSQTVGGNSSASLIGKFDDIHYGSSYGITHQYDVSSGPDFNYRVSSDLEMDTFYEFMRSYRAMATGDSTLGYQEGYEGTTGDTHTFGLSGNWKATDKLKIGAGYDFSYGMEAFSQGGNWGVGTTGSTTMTNFSIPAVTSMDNSVHLKADYEYLPGVIFHMGYGFDRLISNDWALWGSGANGYNPAGVAQLTTGDGNPSYAVHTVMTSVSFKW